MNKILFVLLLFSSACFGQGVTSLIFVPGQGWVIKKLVDSTWIGTQLAVAFAPTASSIQGTVPFNKLTGSDIVLTESQVTNLTTDLSAKAPLASPTFTGTVTLPANAVSNSMLAGSIAYSKLTLTGAILNGDLAGSIAASKLVGSDITLTESQITNLTTDLAARQGVSAASTSATTGTMTVPMTSATQTVFNITPTGACTFNATGGTAGARMTFIITTSGTSAFVLTWGTNFKTTATLSTGTTTAKVFCVNFICRDGTNWYEIGRTTAM